MTSQRWKAVNRVMPTCVRGGGPRPCDERTHGRRRARYKRASRARHVNGRCGEPRARRRQTGFEPSVPPIRETVVDTTSWLTAPAYVARVALSIEHVMLRKIGDSLSAIPADSDTGSEW